MVALSTYDILAVVQRVAADAVGLDDAERIDRIDALETLRRATEAALTETTADFVVSRRQAAADQGIPVERREYEGVTHEFFGTAAVVA